MENYACSVTREQYYREMWLVHRSKYFRLDNVKYVQDTSGATMKWTTSCAAQAHAAVAEETITTLCTTKGQGTPTAAQRNEKECEHHKDIPIDRIHLHHCRPFSYAAVLPYVLKATLRPPVDHFIPLLSNLSFLTWKCPTLHGLATPFFMWTLFNPAGVYVTLQ
uniref:FLYWCH-type domain-containing protein n=1 Tax=Heterorhabditis bacteriophora TaxID=37862 RepID=A0A1I7X2E4_HETBA